METSAEYLRELRSDQALILLTTWLRQTVKRNAEPDFKYPIASVDFYQKRWFLIFRRPTMRIVTRLYSFWKLPSSGGSLYVAQNLMVVAYTGDDAIAPDPAVVFVEDDWTLMDIDDSGTPMEVLDHVVAVLRTHT